MFFPKALAYLHEKLAFHAEETCLSSVYFVGMDFYRSLYLKGLRLFLVPLLNGWFNLKHWYRISLSVHHDLLCKASSRPA